MRSRRTGGRSILQLDASRTAIAVVLGLTTTLTLEAQPAIRLGSEFQVNTYGTEAQRNSNLARESNGDFVVVWMSQGQDGSGFGVFARRFTSAGAPLGVEFRVNSYTTYSQEYPATAMDDDGDFVVVWASIGQDGSDYGVFARRFSSAGSPQASEFQVNTHTTNVQDRPGVAMDGDGDFVIAWESFFEDGESDGVFARRFSSAGSPQATAFQVNAYTTNNQSRPTLAMDSDGDFVIGWRSYRQDGAAYGVFARRWSSAGIALGGEFQVNTYTIDGQYDPALAMDGDGDFVVAWASYGQDGGGYGIFARRFGSAGSALGIEFQVNTYTEVSQNQPAVGVSGDGRFVVVWHSYGFDNGVFARSFDTVGTAQGAEFEANTETVDEQVSPAVDVDGVGGFVVTWTSYSQDPGGGGIFAQRFGAGATLDVDGNGSTGALTDGLLVLRHLFGFTGATLVSGAVAGDCSRCDAATIASYLTGLGSTLDIDGDGSLGPLADGLLVLRFLFGFTGTTLVNGAVDLADCTRCDASTIEAYLHTLG